MSADPCASDKHGEVIVIIVAMSKSVLVVVAGMLRLDRQDVLVI